MIAVFSNPSKDKELVAAKRLVAILIKNGIECQLVEFPKDLEGRVAEVSSLAKSARAIAVLGGDGTMLKAVKATAAYKTPLLGINAGNLGFLTETDPNGVEEAAAVLMDGAYKIEERAMIEGCVSGLTGGTSKKFLALNEIAVREIELKMAYLRLTVDGMPLGKFDADGIIAATPTGSTAYSLAAGGPIMAPNVQALVVTPLNPHSLHCRSFVLSDNSILCIGAYKEQDLRVEADGVFCESVRRGEYLTVTKSRVTARFIKLDGDSFYTKVWHKFSNH